MYPVDWIKKQKIISLLSGIGSFLIMLICNSFENMFENSKTYFWSQTVREGASAFSDAKTFFMVLFLISLGSELLMLYLDKYGTVCETCKLIYPPSMQTCFKCKNDITNAISIQEYWKKSPIIKENMKTSSNNSWQPCIPNNSPQITHDKFCFACGQKLKETDKFCPRCGKGTDKII